MAFQSKSASVRKIRDDRRQTTPCSPFREKKKAPGLESANEAELRRNMQAAYRLGEHMSLLLSEKKRRYRWQ
jgi:hypothetical protein